MGVKKKRREAGNASIDHVGSVRSGASRGYASWGLLQQPSLSYICIFFISKRKREMLFLFIAILICVICTDVIQSAKNCAYTSLRFATNSVA
jgi:hypothetical protein